MDQITQYINLLPFSLIYILLFWLIIPQLTGRWLKVIIAIILIPVAFALAGYVDMYLPRLVYSINRWFRNAF